MARQGNRRGLVRIQTVAIALFGLLGALLLAQLPANAVHDTGAFELEGNAVDDAVAGDDWENVCDQVSSTECSGAGSTTGGTAVTWVPELNLNATIFTGGGSKDPQNINQWAWKDGAGGLPDKDNLLHGFAVRYSQEPSEDCPVDDGNPNTVDPDTCELLYFGSDRYDNSGDAQQGFWFFQDQIGLGDVPKGGGFSFEGLHTAGDVLVISDFSNGGTTSTIKVFKWDPTCKKAGGTCGDANLRTLASSTAANCATASANDAFCGIVNGDDGETAPWTYTDKSGNDSYLQGELYEGGINLSLLGLADECFASAASETRSSTSTTATLKDFVLGSFGSCEAPTTTTPVDENGAAVTSVTLGTEVFDRAVVTGNSDGGDPTGTVDFYVCGPIATGTCDGTEGFEGTSLGDPVDLVSDGEETTFTSTATSEGFTALSVGRYCFRGDYSGDDNYEASSDSASTECFTVTDSTSITSTQSWVPNDSATVTAAGGSALSGTLTFTLYNGTDCGETGTAVANQSYPFTITAGASPVTRSTSNTTAVPAGSYSWLVTFDSSDNQFDSSHCEESTLSVDDHNPASS
jgi:hypothetical protein